MKTFVLVGLAVVLVRPLAEKTSDAVAAIQATRTLNAMPLLANPTSGVSGSGK